MDTSATALKRIGVGVLLLAVGIAVGALAASRLGSPRDAGLVVLAVGQIALALVAFTPREIGAALDHAIHRPRPGEDGRRARQFWESAARNAGLLGALSAFVGLVVLFSKTEGVQDFAGALGERVLGPWLAGIVLAAVCALPALRAPVPEREGVARATASHATPPALPLSAGLGYALFAATLAWLLLAPGTRPDFEPSAWLLRGPAWLAVLGGALAVALYLGEARRGRSVTLALAIAGMVAALLGLLQALHGFAIVRIEMVAAGLTFLLSACVATLVGLGAVALPLEDRARGESEAAACRLVWYGLPIVTVMLLAAAVAMVLTPMTKPAGG